MTQIDEFRIRQEVYITKLNKKLVTFLIWILSKLDSDTLSKCIITDTLEIDMKRYVPQDGEWHRFSYTVDCWIKFNEVVKHEKVYLDGIQKKMKGKKK